MKRGNSFIFSSTNPTVYYMPDNGMWTYASHDLKLTQPDDLSREEDEQIRKSFNYGLEDRIDALFLDLKYWFI